MRSCAGVNTCVGENVRPCVRLNECWCFFEFVCVCVRACVSVSVCEYECEYVCVSSYLCTCVCTCVCVPG